MEVVGRVMELEVVVAGDGIGGCGGGRVMESEAVVVGV